MDSIRHPLSGFVVVLGVPDILRPIEDGTAPRENNNHESDWYRTLVEEVNDLVTVVDTDGTITYVSPAVTRILGYEPDELVGHEGYEFVHPEDRERNVDAMETVLSNPSDSETVEVRFRHADGSWRWIEATMRNRLDDGVIDGILLSSRDITERKQYELEARELAEEYDALLNNVADAIFLINVKRSGDGVRFEFERLIRIIVTVYRWFAGPSRRTTGNDLQ